MGSYQHRMFVWRELMTTNVDAALRFYGELFGWKSESMKMPNGTDYHVLKTATKSVGGMMQAGPEMKMPPAWASYVSVADVDATVAKAKANKGTVPWGPVDVDGVGRMATIVDPQGGALCVMKDANGDPAPARPLPGEFCWEQLNTSDTAASKAFYAEVIGWQVRPFQGMDTFGVGDSMEAQAASVMEAPRGSPTHWLTYVVVEALPASRDRAAHLGAKVLVPSISMPGIGDMAVIQDPQGAVIALFESKMPG